MRKLTTAIIAVIVVFLFVGAAFLATWDIPPPSKVVEKVISDDRFPRENLPPGPGRLWLGSAVNRRGIRVVADCCGGI